MVSDRNIDPSQIFRIQHDQMLIQFLWGRSSNKATDVHIDEGCHQVLTVESVHDSTMTWNDVSKVFDFERSLEPGCEKPAKRTDDRGEDR